MGWAISGDPWPIGGKTGGEVAHSPESQIWRGMGSTGHWRVETAIIMLGHVKLLSGRRRERFHLWARLSAKPMADPGLTTNTWRSFVNDYAPD